MLSDVGMASDVKSDVAPITPRGGISSITLHELKQIFTGKKVNWDNGRAIVLIVLRDDAPTTRVFARDYLSMSPTMMFDTINNQVSSASRNQPTVVDTDREVVYIVSKTPGAIGYASNFIIINNDNIIRTVKVTK